MAGPEPVSKPDQSGAPAAPVLETAHVLFIDVVGYSLLHMDRQTSVLHELQRAVSDTAAFRRAQAENQLVSLPTGDGMALVFFREPLAPVECAVELTRSLRSAGSEIPLRMGIHTGSVYRVADINANRNVAGGGINMAQRVMDCGDAGHILLSRASAETLLQLSQWAGHIHDLGEQEVKHGVRIHLYNLALEDAGNTAIPKKVTAVTANASRPAAGVASTRKTATWVISTVAIALLLLSATWLATREESGSPPATAAAPARSFHYSILVQQYRDGEPYRDSFVLPGEMIFQPDYRIRLQVTSSDSGNLYVLNQGPETSGSEASYHILFPESGQPASVPAEQLVQVPEGEGNWFVFDEQEGTEQLWLIWAAQPLEIFEAAKAYADATHRGVISDQTLKLRIQSFLEPFRRNAVQSVRDEEQRRTTVSGGDVMAKLVRLEHR